MSLWIIVGGQYGSEGKGKIAAHITNTESIDIAIRCGGPNSGHSYVNENGLTVLLRQLPIGAINPNTRLLIPAGALIDLDILKRELYDFNLDLSRVGVDKNSMIISSKDIQNEEDCRLNRRLSSTLCGVGSAVSRRAMRGSDVRLAKDAASSATWLKPLLTNVSSEANAALDSNKKVLVEGTQGFGLSLYHTAEYPKATSRDTSAAAFLSEIGLSPLLVDEIVTVFRTYPIRVSGKQAGSLSDELSWKQLQKESGYPYEIGEFTNVTKKLRRVSRFDWGLFKKSILVNRPTKIAITGLDYLDFQNKGCTSEIGLTIETRRFLNKLEEVANVPINYFSTGSGINEMFSIKNF